MIRIFIVLSFVLFFLTPHSNAQKSRPDYNLLWKITGKDLKKPSYLFGTMHVRDKRAFDFSDSVLVKLQECKIFAMEVHPDSMLSEVFSQLTKETEAEEDTTNILKNKLSKEEYALLDKRIESETGMHLDQMKDKSPKSIVMILENTAYSKGNKSTFLDAYLYRLSLQQKKEIAGLEEIGDHLSVLDLFNNHIEQIQYYIQGKENVNYTESLLDAYWQGDLKKIDNYFKGMDPVMLEKLLYKRNVKMVASIEELARKDAAFIAVGAGHLPGSQGVIQLLKSKGYTVTPVKATFTGLAAKYKETPIDLPWVEFKSEEHSYTLQFPSKPFPYKYSTLGVPFEMFVYPDLASGLFYYTFSVQGVDGRQSEEAMMKQMVDAYSQSENVKLLSQKKTRYKEYPAIDVDLFSQTHSMYMRMRVVVRKNTVHLLLLGSYVKNLLNSPEGVKFFNSLEFQEFKNPTWKALVSDEGGFEITAPFEMKSLDVKSKDNREVKTVLFNAADPVSHKMYFAGYYIMPSGSYFMDDSSYISNAINNMVQYSGGTLTESEEISLDGYPGKTFTIQGNASFHYRGRMYIRGSRPYVYFALTSPDNIQDKDVTDFLNSFRFRPYLSATWKPYQSKEYGFKLMVPSKEYSEIDSSGFYSMKQLSETFDFQDSSSGQSYSITVMKNSPYYFQKEEDFFKMEKDNYVGERDSLLSETDITVNGLKGKELYISSKDYHSIKRMRFIPKDNNLFIVFSILPKEEAWGKTANNYFNSLQFTDKNPKNNLFKSKADLLLKDLSSSDSVTREEAKTYLYRYTFQQSDLPLLRQAVQKNYTDDTSGYQSTRSSIFISLEELKDPEISIISSKLYSSLNDELKISCLKALINTGNKASTDMFVKLLKEKVPSVKYLPYGFFESFADSIELNKQFLPKIFFLYKEQVFRSRIYQLANLLADSNLLPPALIDLKTREDMCALAIHDLETLIKKDAEGYYWYSNISEAITLLKRYISEPAVSNSFKKIASSSNTPLAMMAVQALVEKGMEVSPQQIENLAADREQRISIYDVLAKENKLNLFPGKWLKQEYFAESDLWNHLTLYDIYPDTIALVESKVATVNGTKSRFYLFKYGYKEDEEKMVWETGLSGPHPEDKKKITTSCAGTVTLYETLEDKTIKQHFESLLKACERILSETEDEN